jgi:CTP:molybdopterin cytidylyltransferase MocA
MRRVLVVLAAGSGSRMGGPKALLDLDGVPLAIAHVNAHASLVARALVVLRASVAATLKRFDPSLETIISDRDDALGPAGSLAAVAQELAPDDRVIVQHVDRPIAARATLDALFDALDRDGVLAARPTHAGRRGHPIGARGACFEAYRDATPTLRDVLRALGQACVDVPVDDAAILANLTTPADMQQHLGRPPRFL